MKKVQTKAAVREGFAEVIQLGLPGVVRQGLREVIFDQGMRVVMDMLEDERTAFCGQSGLGSDDEARGRRREPAARCRVRAIAPARP